MGWESRGTRFLAGKRESVSKHPRGLPGRQVFALFEDHAANLWVGVDRGIFIYEQGRFRPILNPISENGTVGAISFAEDAQHTIWAVLAGTTAGILRIQDFQVKELIPTSQVSAAFSAVPDNKGGVWVSLLDGNLAHYAQGGWQTISLDQSDGRRNLFNISWIRKAHSGAPRHEGSSDTRRAGSPSSPSGRAYPAISRTPLHPIRMATSGFSASAG